MVIYFLYGKTGAGKSHIGKVLEELNVTHIDGDGFITQRMRDCLIEDEQMTSDMIDEFVGVLIKVINQQRENAPNRSFAISQAMYLDKNRVKLLNAVPELKFVLIDAPHELRASRISSRFNSNQSKVSLDYAVKMDAFFEPATHELIVFENKKTADDKLAKQIKTKMPELFCDEPNADLNGESKIRLTY